MSIPKKIHYCWFGGKPLPEEYKNYINSWKKYCPDYKIIEWNENTFDVKSNTYVEEAYKAKKWAFITDYVRLYVLYKYGGIYMDTDVEIIKPIDSFLKHKAFSGFESNANIPTGIMASEKGFGLYKEFLDYYKDKHFIKVDGSYDTTTNVAIMTEICKKYGLKQDNTKQIIKDWVLYPSDYFCPKDSSNGVITITKNTHVIHHFSGSWMSDDSRARRKRKSDLCKKFGKRAGLFVYYTVFMPYIIVSVVREEGFLKLIAKAKNKVFKKKV